MPEAQQPFDPSMFQNLDEMREVFPEEAENFRAVEHSDFENFYDYSEEERREKLNGFVKKAVLNDEAARKDVGENDKRKTPDKEDTGKVDLSKLNRWIKCEYGKTEEEKEKARQEYLVELEKIYGEFKSQYGEVDSSALAACFKSKADLGDFLSKHKEYDNPSGSHYDLGYRWLIDIVISSDQTIDEEVRKKVTDHFMSVSPYYGFKSKGTGQFPRKEAELVDSFRNKEELTLALKYIYKKCRKVAYISQPYNLMGVLLDSQEKSEAWIAWEESFPESYKVLDPKANLTGDATYNPQFNSDIYRMNELSNGDSPGTTREYDSGLSAEAKEEFFQEAEAQFGGSFSLPQILE